MLVQFSVTNYKTFKEKATLSLIASNYDKETRESENVCLIEKFNLRILRSAVVYGANASGKSKLVEAFGFMRRFVISSSREGQKGDLIKVDPFRLSTETENLPSEFEASFIHENVLYRYGFEATKEKIISEWLYYREQTKEVELFYRDGGDFETHKRNFSKGNAVIREGLVRDNALLVSVASQFNEEKSIAVTNWFKEFKVISGLFESGHQGYTMGKTQNPILKEKILHLVHAADLGIQDIRLQKLDIDKLPKELPKEVRDRIILEMRDEHTEYISDILTSHRKYDANHTFIEQVDFSLEEDESAGTMKYFAMTGPILDVLENGYTLVVDELDSKIHPNLVCKLVSMFNSAEMNPKNAQLIFNTHDTNLLSSGLFRRDQVWFTEKNKYGEGRLFSLADFKSDTVRKNELFEENYIKGKYGAVPHLGFFDTLVKVLG